MQKNEIYYKKWGCNSTIRVDTSRYIYMSILLSTFHEYWLISL